MKGWGVLVIGEEIGPGKRAPPPLHLCKNNAKTGREEYSFAPCTKTTIICRNHLSLSANTLSLVQLVPDLFPQRCRSVIVQYMRTKVFFIKRGELHIQFPQRSSNGERKYREKMFVQKNFEIKICSQNKGYFSGLIRNGVSFVTKL